MLNDKMNIYLISSFFVGENVDSFSWSKNHCNFANYSFFSIQNQMWRCILIKGTTLNS